MSKKNIVYVVNENGLKAVRAMTTEIDGVEYQKNVNAAFLLTGYGMGVISHALSVLEENTFHECDHMPQAIAILKEAKEYYSRVLDETVYKVKAR